MTKLISAPTINGTRIIADAGGPEGRKTMVAWDGCHKIYLISSNHLNEIEGSGYKAYPLEELPRIWKESCELRFISTWDLTIQLVGQFEDAQFVGWE